LKAIKLESFNHLLKSYDVNFTNAYIPAIVEQTATNVSVTYSGLYDLHTFNVSHFNKAFKEVFLSLAHIVNDTKFDVQITTNTTSNNHTSTHEFNTNVNLYHSLESPKAPNTVLYIIIGVITAVALIITVVLIVSLNRKSPDGYQKLEQ